MDMSIAKTSKPEKAGGMEQAFRAFTDRTRLRILYLLQDGELCVSDIVGILRLPQAKVSHHLKYLCRAGFVDMRKNGLWSFYRLTATPTALHSALLDCLAPCRHELPELAADRKRAAKVKASGGCCPK